MFYRLAQCRDRAGQFERRRRRRSSCRRCRCCSVAPLKTHIAGPCRRPPPAPPEPLSVSAPLMVFAPVLVPFRVSVVAPLVAAGMIAPPKLSVAELPLRRRW